MKGQLERKYFIIHQRQSSWVYQNRVENQDSRPTFVPIFRASFWRFQDIRGLDFENPNKLEIETTLLVLRQSVLESFQALPQSSILWKKVSHVIKEKLRRKNFIRENRSKINTEKCQNSLDQVISHQKSLGTTKCAFVHVSAITPSKFEMFDIGIHCIQIVSLSIKQEFWK